MLQVVGQSGRRTLHRLRCRDWLQQGQQSWQRAVTLVLASAIALTAGNPICTNAAETTEPAIDVGEIVRELQICLSERSQGTDAPESLVALQAISLECLYSATIVAPDGSIRPDASDRLQALVTSAGLELPAAQSRGSAVAALSPVPDSNLFALEVRVRDQPLKFLLDTGASNSLLSAAALARLGLAGIPVPQKLLEYLVVGDRCDLLEAQIVNLPTASIAAAQVFGITSISLTRSPIFTATGADGVLGLDFLQGFDTIIDPATRQLHLTPRTEISPEAIPLEGRLGVAIATVAVNGQGPYQFLLDTGANHSVITPEVARSANVPAGTPIEVQGFCGPETGQQVRLDRLSIDTFAATDLEATILESEVLQLLGVDGIVGQNFLNRYRQTWQFGPPNALGFPDRGGLILEPIP